MNFRSLNLASWLPANEIAVDLGLYYRTLEVHRRHIMEKIGARNTAELVRLAIES